MERGVLESTDSRYLNMRMVVFNFRQEAISCISGCYQGLITVILLKIQGQKYIICPRIGQIK